MKENFLLEILHDRLKRPLIRGIYYLLDELIVDCAAELIEELNWMARGRVVWDLLAWRVARLRRRHARHRNIGRCTLKKLQMLLT